MSTARHSVSESLVLHPEGAETREAIREQLERLLESPLFRNSKRYPNLLRHVVDRTLAGRAFELKERTLGVEVFGRSPDYDCSLDPVVRTSAAEIRKRIAQYYHEDRHQNEIRIDLPLGSYIPKFHSPNRNGPVALAIPLANPQAASLPPAAAARGRAARNTSMAVALLVLAVTAAVALWHRPNPVDQFWRPVLRGSEPVLVCVELEPSPAGQMAEAGRTASSNTVLWNDVVTLSTLTGLLQAKGRLFGLQREDRVSFSELQQGPSVLLGAFNSPWTMRLFNGERFGVEEDGTERWITDRQHTPRRRWGVDLRKNDIGDRLDATEDYAIISRTMNPATGRVVVALAGLGGSGTLAAGEFLTEPRYLRAVVDKAPRDWDRKSLQVVIKTEVIGRTPGPPQVVETHFW